MLTTNASELLNQAIRRTTTAAELQKQVILFAHELDFELANLVTVFDHSDSPSDFFTVDNTPDAYKAAYHDPCLGQADPVMQHCKRSSTPIIWDQDTYVSSGRGGLWEYQARYGYKSGIAVAIHSVGGRHIFLGLDRSRPIPKDPNVRAHLLTELRAFARSANEVAFDIFDPRGTDKLSFKPALSTLEIEILRWSMDGVSPAEIARITRIDLNIIASDIHNIIRKLGCSSKYHAIIKAIRLGLLK